MRVTGRSCARSRGIVLLEALIAVLILSLAMPGFLGLATRALQDAANAHWRSEAASLADSTMAAMWLENPATLASRYDSAADGPGLRRLVAAASRLPGVTSTVNVPVVEVVEGAVGASPRVTLTLFWQSPADAASHRYVTEQLVAPR
ncbi:MAG: type IV pilus modification PilV family protein [Candidatus Levyibacteriota bacterium]